MRKNHILQGIFLVLFLGMTFQTFSQKFKKVEKQSLSMADIVITGSKEVTINDTKTYYANAQGVSVYMASWDVKGATILEQNSTSVVIRWDEAGNKIIGYSASTNRGRLESSYAVSVSAADAPETPATPEISSQTCTSAVIKSTGTPPSGVTWYWQGGNPNGTRIAQNSETNFSVSNSGRFYLRARNSSGIWSTSSSSVLVTLGTGGTTWYADTDGDGLGDPNTTLVQCIQPNGYVSNSDDLCPEANGTGNPNGCPVNANDAIYENYVYTIVPQKPTTSITSLTSDSDKMEGITYFDGLGRARQSIGIKQSPRRKDIVTHIDYDGLGRQTKEYLPYASTTNDRAFKTDALAKTNSYYKTHYPSDFEGVAEADINPYSEKAMELSPLNRVVEQTAPGTDWKISNTKITGKDYSTARSIKLEYGTNNENEVKNYSVKTDFIDRIYKPTLEDDGFFSANELIKTITKDENWTASDGVNNTTEEFKNKNGQVVLKRSYNNNQKHDTYYVYDDFGNLTYVFPPKTEASIDKPSAIELLELCYQYKYDDRNRMVEKKIPGKGWEYVVYDNLDRPVLTQDANQELEGKWLFTKYDVFGRVIYTGIFTSNSSRDNLQTTFTNKSTTQNYESKLTYGGDLGFYYSNGNFPKDNLEVLTVNYYDNYIFDMAGTITPSGIGLVYGESLTNNVKGLATGSKVKVLDTDKWITTVSYYDEKARPIYTYSKNEFLESSDIVKTQLDFVGKTLLTESYHTKADDNISETIANTDRFKYDHTGRLLEQTQSGTARVGTEVIVSNTYDELGHLIIKGVGGKTTQKRLQDVDYKYNVRGWLTHINDIGNSNASVSLDDKDLFGFEINYNKPSEGKALYNGNISQTLWKTKSINPTANPVSSKYSYEYDNLNRITKATDNTGNYNLNLVSYDKNGNILTLSRNGHLNTNATSFGVMDNLIYTYDSGNKLTKVLDNGDGNFGFKDGNTSAVDYFYDENGNLIKDKNKGIELVTYNYLNLPTRVELGAGKIVYRYDASGLKQRKIVTDNFGNETITDYINGFIYKKSGDTDKELQFFATIEGYVKNEAGKFSYVYQYKDHLGNSRLNYSDSNNNGTIEPETEILEENHYYPFGGKLTGINPIVNGREHKYKYNGKELQDELGLNWYDYGARNYDPYLGRWMNIDPLAEMYDDNSPYNYVKNNPIYFVDPDGMQIDLSDIFSNEENFQNGIDLLLQLSEQTGLTLSVNSENGFLEYEKEEDGKTAKVKESNGQKLGSSLARTSLIDAIDHSDFVSVKMSETNIGSKTSNKNNIIRLDPIQIATQENNVSQRLNPMTLGLGMTFFHELFHTQVGGSLDDTKELTSKGPTVEKMNIIRKQLDANPLNRTLGEGTQYGIRKYYNATQVSKKSINRRLDEITSKIKFIVLNEKGRKRGANTKTKVLTIKR